MTGQGACIQSDSHEAVVSRCRRSPRPRRRRRASRPNPWYRVGLTVRAPMPACRSHACRDPSPARVRPPTPSAYRLPRASITPAETTGLAPPRIPVRDTRRESNSRKCVVRRDRRTRCVFRGRVPQRRRSHRWEGRRFAPQPTRRSRDRETVRVPEPDQPVEPMRTLSRQAGDPPQTCRKAMVVACAEKGTD